MSDGAPPTDSIAKRLARPLPVSHLEDEVEFIWQRNWKMAGKPLYLVSDVFTSMILWNLTDVHYSRHRSFAIVDLHSKSSI